MCIYVQLFGFKWSPVHGNYVKQNYRFSAEENKIPRTGFYNA